MRTTKEYVMRKHFNENGDTVYLETENDLIRCKDCKFYHKTEDDQFCGQGSVVAFDEHYCSIAERKEE